MKNLAEWVFGAKLFLKFGILLVSVGFIDNTSDMPIGTVIFIGILVLLAVALGIESLLKWASSGQKCARIAIDAAACASTLGCVAVAFSLQFLPATWSIGAFVAAFALPYLVCLVYLTTLRPNST